jgi:hypothetical protein
VHEWVKTYERFWIHQLNRIKERAEHKAREQVCQHKQYKPNLED